MENKRYSDNELQEFKKLIEEKLLVAEFDYKRLKERFSNEAGNKIDDTSPAFKPYEDGSKMQIER